MTSLLQIVRDRLLGSERGQTLAEYSIIISVIAVGVVTLALADAKGIDPDWIHRDDERWKRAAARHKG